MANAQSSRAIVIGAELVLVGLWLASDPRCRRGCRTIAGHLIDHGLREFLMGFAA